MNDANGYVLLGNIVIGFFTLSAALGGIWLKDYLDNKKIFKSTIRQSAIKSCSVCEKIVNSLNTRIIVCRYLLNDKNFKYGELIKNNPDISLNLLENLELLIIESFYDLMPYFDNVQTPVLEFAEVLIEIQCNISNSEFKLNRNDFEKKLEYFRDEIIDAITVLKKQIKEKYINNKYAKKNNS